MSGVRNTELKLFSQGSISSHLQMKRCHLREVVFLLFRCQSGKVSAIPSPALIMSTSPREVSRGCTFKEQNGNPGTALLLVFNLFPGHRSVVTRRRCVGFGSRKKHAFYLISTKKNTGSKSGQFLSYF